MSSDNIQFESPLATLFNPKSVAVIGASPKPGTPRNLLVKNLLKHGFSGAVYPISQSHDSVEGLSAYKTVGELPEIPDVALIITPAATVADVIEECGAKGIRQAVVFSAGFEEVEGGDVFARQLEAAAARHKMTVIGPNCNGLWSVKNRAILTFSGAAHAIDTLNHAPIAVVSQSGALAGAIGTALNTSGLGLSYIISVGNETCFDVLEAADSVIQQEDVRVLALYLEGLDNAHRLLDLADRARRRNIQIVALKTGRSAKGQEATASHTGKIASSHVVYADVFRQAGIIEAQSIAELITAVEVLAFMASPRCSSDPSAGISVLSASGGAGALLADHCSELGMEMSTFADTTVTKLANILPSYARGENPVDLTVEINNVPSLLSDSCRAVVADPRTEALVVQFASTVHRHLESNKDAFEALAQDVPVLLSVVGVSVDRALKQSLLEAGVLVCSDPAAAMNALSLLYQRARFLGQANRPTYLPQELGKVPNDWPSAMAFCEQSGIAAAPWRILRPGENAAQICEGLRFPLVVKALPEDSDHKTELGLVALRVNSADAVDAIAGDFRQKMNKADAGILVQEMISGGIEIVMSCLRNADFGPVISIGTGGVAIELYRDVTHLALPVSEEHVIDALKRLKLWTLLEGFRGEPRADIEALARAAVELGNKFLATPEMQEFEMNPIIVKAAGEGLYTVDALVS